MGPGTELGIAVAVTTAVNWCHLSKDRFRKVLPSNKWHLSLKWGESVWRLGLHMQNPSALIGEVGGCTAGQGQVTHTCPRGDEGTGSTLLDACSLWQLLEIKCVFGGSLLVGVTSDLYCWPWDYTWDNIYEIIVGENSSISLQLHIALPVLGFLTQLLSKSIWELQTEKHRANPHANKCNYSDCSISWWLLLISLSLQHRPGSEQVMRMKWRSWLPGLHKSMVFSYRWHEGAAVAL